MLVGQRLSSAGLGLTLVLGLGVSVSAQDSDSWMRVDTVRIRSDNWMIL